MRSPSRNAVRLSALAIAAFEVVGTFGAGHNQPDRKAVDALAILLVLVGPAALAVRDRMPRLAVAAAMGSSVVYVGLGYPFGPIFVSVVVALFAAVLAGHRQDIWALTTAGYLAFVVAEVLDSRAEGSSWLHWLLVAGWLVVVLAVAEVVRGRREQAAARARSVQDERQRRLGQQRLTLAQELHDLLAHNISLVHVQASVALHLLDEQPERAGPALAAIKDASHDALQELRAALDLLRDGDAPRAPAPRLSDLGALVDGVRATGLEVRLDQQGDTTGLSTAIELAVYRIVQEALTNVTRHAHAATATVRVRVGDDGSVTVEVVDDGVGGAAQPGNGLVGMHERATALGGSIDAAPRPAGGFRVRARLPGGAA
jgi:signal transduction histidine kinase